jgi:hypothetical protein
MPRQDRHAELPAGVDADKRTVIAASPEARSSEGKARASTAGSREGLRPSPVAIEVNETKDGKAGARFTTLRNVAAQAERSFASEAHTATRMSAETAMNGKPFNELSVERPSAEIKGPARDDSPTKSAATMKASMRDTQSDLDTGPRRSAIPPLEDRFNIVSRGLVSKDYEFRDQPGKIAFSESLLKLSSQTDSPAAAKAMVDRALERGWETVRVSGSSEFKRQAWIAATAHGIKAIGHAPTPGDRQTAEKERARVELSRGLRDAPGRQLAESTKAQGGTVAHADPVGGRVGRSSAIRDRQLAAAFDKALRDGKVPANLRDQMRERMAAEGARRAGQGERFNVRVYDPKAPRAKPKTLNVGPQRVADRERAR